jgi:hypothetical protein
MGSEGSNSNAKVDEKDLCVKTDDDGYGTPLNLRQKAKRLINKFRGKPNDTYEEVEKEKK